MDRVKLVRFLRTKNEIFGFVIKNKLPIVITLEPPWKFNRRNESCIPSGIYLCEKNISKRLGLAIDVYDVTDRDDIKFHIGNTVKDTTGCICVGTEPGRNKEGLPAVLNSKVAMKKFYDCLPDKFELEITENF